MNKLMTTLAAHLGFVPAATLASAHRQLAAAIRHNDSLINEIRRMRGMAEFGRSRRIGEVTDETDRASGGRRLSATYALPTPRFAL